MYVYEVIPGIYKFSVEWPYWMEDFLGVEVEGRQNERRKPLGQQGQCLIRVTPLLKMIF